ncbi:response regulator [Telmatocola sphagniphila]|uniref:histidine kinase n=1 Tax=Telmatocola sphagniphila TaxID=1123043 RepID=A0A8E6EXI8_9BACT|nr:response regulator [Telmatocola sphagniphila]QVL31316.1 response regulator [Telmatocola sphagniphila]
MKPSAQGTILIVDDQEVNRYTTTRILRDVGFSTLEAKNGQEGLRLAETGPDLILLDVNLPDIDGFQVCRILKSNPNTEQIPVVHASATFVSDRDKAQGLDDGADGYLVRPVEACVLVATVRSCIRARRAEEKISQQQRQLQTLADNCPDILTRFDLEHRHIFVSAAIERATGRASSEFLGRTNRELGLPENLCDFWEAAIQTTIDSRQPQSIEYSFPSQLGPRHYISRLIPEFNREGDVESVLSVVTDITERRETEEVLRITAERLQLAAEAANFGTYDVDLSTGQVYWSPQMRVIFGVAPEGNVDDFLHNGPPGIHPEDRDRFLGMIRTLQRSESLPSSEIEFRLVSPEGDIRWVLLLGRNYFTEAGPRQPVRISGVSFDITDRKIVEESLRDADRRKNEFLAMLAHELRNPLAPIRNAMQILRLAPEREAQERARQMVDRQLGQLVRLVDDLLDVSRISQGKLKLRKERIDLASVLANAVETSRPLIEQMGHELLVTLPNPSIEIDGDATRLAQVFMNLLNNAAKYSERGSRIWLSAHAEGAEAVITVRDNGIGIAVDQLPRIFELFAQVDRSLEKSQGGLGIGLTLVKQLVELHSGKVEAKSSGSGQGSEFSVRLPILTTIQVAKVDAANQNGDMKKTSLRVLVVDDNRDGADSLAMMLRLMGNETRTAYDGEEALALASRFLPDAILLDLGLPKVNGYDVCRRIRELSGNRRPLIIAQTGWGQNEDRLRTAQAGFDEHMIKPINPEAVLQMLRKLENRMGKVSVRG